MVEAKLNTLMEIAEQNIISSIHANHLTSAHQLSSSLGSHVGFLDFSEVLRLTGDSGHADYCQSAAFEIAQGIKLHLFVVGSRSFIQNDNPKNIDKALYPKRTCQVFPQSSLNTTPLHQHRI